MLLKSDIIANRLEAVPRSKDPLIIEPLPDLDELKSSGSAAVDLRLGTWFVTMKHTKIPFLEVDQKNEYKFIKQHYVRFGTDFILHPGSFALGVTLEWIRLPADLGAYVVGKSSWGRRGLIIATAAGVHPGFTGCLTLELSNVGEIPIAIKPGMNICQLFIHSLETGSGTKVDKSNFNGKRKPVVGNPSIDTVMQKLSRE